MTTTLREKIDGILCKSPPNEPWSWGGTAAALLALIEAEKAAAWEEGVNHMRDSVLKSTDEYRGVHPNPYRSQP